jgi:hypothetical protein
VSVLTILGGNYYSLSVLDRVEKDPFG